MSARHLTAVLAAALWALGLTACGSASVPRLPPGTPVVLLVVDTLRADRLGAYGYQRPTSPEIDRWARHGVLFEHAFSTAPWTLPSIASILTGRTPQRHGAGRFPQAKAGEVQWVKTRLEPSVPTLATVLRAQGYATGVFATNTFFRRRFGLHQGFETHDVEGHKGSLRRPAEHMVDAALTWIQERGDDPFLLMLHLMDPHLPYHPPASARGRFAGERVGRFAAPIADVRKIRRARPPLDREEREFVSAIYDEEVAYVDLHVGRFLGVLAARGLMERSLVIFVADHGEEFWDHGGFEHGHAFHQELLHVPLVIWGPGVRARRVDQPVSQVDVLPTVLDALGVDMADEVDGVSLWPVLAEGVAPEPREIVAHNTLRGPDGQALVAWPWKLVVSRAHGPAQLYNLATDPGETLDRATEERERTQDLMARLREALPQDAASLRGRAVELDDETRRELEALGYIEAPASAPVP